MLSSVETSRIKHKIKSQFNKAAMTYDQHCQVQILAIERLLEMILCIRPDFRVIIDLGCGTGESTIRLLNSIRCQHAIAVDLADALLNRAVIKCKSHSPLFLLADFDDVLFKDKSCDLIVANMGLQWSLQFESTLHQLFLAIQSGGVLAFSMPLAGTFVELPVSKRNQFYTGDQVIDLLKASGFGGVNYHEFVEQQYFSTPYSRAKAINSVGATTVLPCAGDPVKMYHSQPERIVKQNHALTYHIGLFVAIKGK